MQQEQHIQHATFSGNLILIGCGSVGQATLPLFLRHITMSPKKVTIIDPDAALASFADKYGVNFVHEQLTVSNYPVVLGTRCANGDIVLNIANDVSSFDIINWCQKRGVRYMDTSLEEWPEEMKEMEGHYSEHCDYHNRNRVRALDPKDGAPRPTALIASGANPGVVNYFYKAALLDIARDTGVSAAPHSQQDWANLSMQLGVKTVHISERDTQKFTGVRKLGELINTWSAHGIYAEGVMASEIGWGTHEKELPRDGHEHGEGSRSAIYLDKPGCITEVRSFVPLVGPIVGCAITHNETLSMSEYYTVRDEVNFEQVRYRPTVHYAYYPSDEAVASMREVVANNFAEPTLFRVVTTEIAPGGVDELGVLLMGHAKNAYWLGTSVSVDDARAILPHTNATALQVAAGLLAGMVALIEHPNEGIIETDDVDHVRALEIARPYLGTVKGVYTDWNPLQGNKVHVQNYPAQDIDLEDPWQFKNFRIS